MIKEIINFRKYIFEDKYDIKLIQTLDQKFSQNRKNFIDNYLFKNLNIFLTENKKRENYLNLLEDLEININNLPLQIINFRIKNIV